MAQNGLAHLLRYLHRRSLGQAGGLPDSALLERYVQARDEAAFELLVWRHGSLVLNLCRRILRNNHDVDDAFQATFAALACKARTIRGQNSVAPWLFKVAYRTALAARSRSQRHVSLERAAEPLAASDDDLLWRDLREVLDSEVHRLSARYRDAFVLCYLQGLTHAEAAIRLGCPEGTVHSRLATAKEKLRRGLERRGVTLSGTGMALEFATRHAAVAPGVELIQKTLTTVGVISGTSLAGTTVQSSAITLTRGVLLTMWMQSLAAPALVAVVLGVAGLGIGSLGWQTKKEEPTQDRSAASKVVENPNQHQKAESQQQKGTAEPELPRKKELAQKRKEINSAIETLQEILQNSHQNFVNSRRQLSEQLIGVEAELAKIENRNALALERERKMLTSLEDEQISLAKALRVLSSDPKVSEKQIDVQKLSSQLKEVELQIDRKTDTIAILKQSRFRVDQFYVPFQVNAEKLRQTLHWHEERAIRTRQFQERQLEILEQKDRELEELEFMEEFPDLKKLLNDGDVRKDSNRLETKLDQVLHELIELKKQVGKP